LHRHHHKDIGGGKKKGREYISVVVLGTEQTIPSELKVDAHGHIAVLGFALLQL